MQTLQTWCRLCRLSAPKPMQTICIPKTTSACSPARSKVVETLYHGTVAVHPDSGPTFHRRLSCPTSPGYGTGAPRARTSNLPSSRVGSFSRYCTGAYWPNCPWSSGFSIRRSAWKQPALSRPFEATSSNRLWAYTGENFILPTAS